MLATRRPPNSHDFASLLQAFRGSLLGDPGHPPLPLRQRDRRALRALSHRGPLRPLVEATAAGDRVVQGLPHTLWAL